MKVSARLGWSRTGHVSDDYHEHSVQRVEGVDFRGTDGFGNVIEVGLRSGNAGDLGYRISVNGKDITTGGRNDG